MQYNTIQYNTNQNPFFLFKLFIGFKIKKIQYKKVQKYIINLVVSLLGIASIAHFKA